MKKQPLQRTGFAAVVFAFCALFAQPVPAASNAPVVILANGFGDCCTDRMNTLIDGLKKMGASFPALELRGLDGSQYAHYVVPWNSLSSLDQGFQVNMDPMSYIATSTQALSNPGSILNNLSDPIQALSDPNVIEDVMSKVRKGTDSQFIDEVAAYVGKLDASRPVILIGHSFGADSVIKVSSEIKRPVLFVGAIDPVGAGGLRRLFKGRKIPDRVTYFYTRWQDNALFPFDFRSNGVFSGCQAKTCDQEKQSGSLSHVDLPSNSAIQSEMLSIIGTLLGGAQPVEPQSSGDQQPPKLQDLLDNSKLKGLF
jgi:hypothetical protein